MQRDDASGMWQQWVAPRGTAHVKDAHTNYVLAGGIPIAASDYWSGDVSVNHETGSFNPSAVGGGDSIGTGDRVWGPGSGSDGALKEKYTAGTLVYGPIAGLCSVRCGFDLSSANWTSGCCD